MDEEVVGLSGRCAQVVRLSTPSSITRQLFLANDPTANIMNRRPNWASLQKKGVTTLTHLALSFFALCFPVFAPCATLFAPGALRSFC